MAIGEKIKNLREESGLTQRQLARKAGVDQGGLSKIERGLKANLTLEMLRRLARALGCSAADLLDDEDKKSPRKTAA
ncbi:MAG: helix-turn-helix domain-containing protein [Pyrinomonadaceae bacterium]